MVRLSMESAHVCTRAYQLSQVPIVNLWCVTRDRLRHHESSHLPPDGWEKMCWEPEAPEAPAPKQEAPKMTSRSNSDWVGSLSHSGGTCTDKWEKQLLGWGHFSFWDVFTYATCIQVCPVSAGNLWFWISRQPSSWKDGDAWTQECSQTSSA